MSHPANDRLIDDMRDMYDDQDRWEYEMRHWLLEADDAAYEEHVNTLFWQAVNNEMGKETS